MARSGRILAATGSLALLWGACLLDVDGTAPLGSGGAGGVAPTGGSGGVPPTCNAEDCPPPSGPCVTPACRADGSCGEDPYNAGRKCGDAGETCDGFGACKLPLGAGCQGDDACLSSFCVSNVCCNEACLGECVRCDAGGSEGTCTPREPASTTCDTDGTCDGLGSCAKGTLVHAATYGASGDQHGWDLAVDPVNDLLLAGGFGDTFTFAGETLSASDGHDPFVIKLSPDAQTARWHRSFPTGGSDPQENYAREIEVDAMGNVIVCGIFDGSIELVPNQSTNGFGGRDIFVVKLDGTTGATLWHRVFGSGSDDVCYGMDIDAAGDVYFGGYNDAEITIGTNALPYGGNQDAYVAKLSGVDGSHVWSRSFGGGNDQRVRDVRWFDGSVFITGWASDNINLATNYTGLSGNRSIYVARLDGTGTPQWDQLWDNNQNNGVNELALGPTGHATISGYFRGTLDFGFGDVSASGSDAYVLQLDVATGNPRWLRTFGGNGDQYSYALDVGDDGQVSLGVDFTNQVVFEETIGATSSFDNVLIRLAGDGTTLWTRHLSGNGNEFAEGLLAIGGNDARIVYTGWFSSELIVNGTTMPDQGQEDLFITIHSP